MNSSPRDGVAIEFRNVSYCLDGGRELLSQLNLEILRGETLVLLGRSGSGKTTTLKLINRLLAPTAGEVVVDGRPTTTWDVIRLRSMIGYVIQREFQALQMRLQKTVVFVTHDMREALLLGTRIALIEAGRLVALNTPQAFLHSKDPLVAFYVDAFRTDLTTPRN